MKRSELIKSVNSAEVYSKWPILINEVDYFSPESTPTSENVVKTSVNVFSLAVKPLTIALIIVAYPAAITLMKVIQAIEYLMLINVKKIPRNVREVLRVVAEGSIIDGVIEPMMGDFWKFNDPAANSQEDDANLLTQNERILETTKFCKPHEVFLNEEMGCIGWNNVGAILLQVLIFALIRLLLASVKNKFDSDYEKSEEVKAIYGGSTSLESAVNLKVDKTLESAQPKTKNTSRTKRSENIPRVKSKLYKLIVKLNNFFGFEFFINFMIAVQMDLLMGAFVGLKYGSVSSLIDLFSTALSLTIIIGYFVLVVFVTTRLHKLSENNLVLMA